MNKVDLVVKLAKVNRIIIYINKSLMLCAKFKSHPICGSGDDFLKFFFFFRIYGHGGHLGHVIRTNYINFCSCNP